MYFSAEDRGEMMSMVYNWPADQVIIVLSCPIENSFAYISHSAITSY